MQKAQFLLRKSFAKVANLPGYQGRFTQKSQKIKGVRGLNPAFLAEIRAIF
ncbi:MAG: hypothetical protein ACO3DK_09685 [Bacteroidia bacterium]